MRSKLSSLLLAGLTSLAAGCTTYVHTEPSPPTVVETRPPANVNVEVKPRTAERPARKVEVDVNAPGVNVDVQKR